MKRIFVVMLVGLAVFGWGCGKETVNGPGNVKLAKDCEKEQFPFACYLDKAMAASNPSLCADAGKGRRMNCIRSYEEILETKVVCSTLQDPEFQKECEASFTAPAPATTTETNP